MTLQYRAFRFLLLFLSLNALPLSYGAEREEGEVQSLIGATVYTPKDGDNDDLSQILPFVLTSRNFGSAISDKKIWLVEVYAPWCGHCVSFAGTYNEIAAHYHSDSNKKLGIRVGKINGDDEKALMTRFNVKSFPNFFVVDGWNVYKFEQQRNKILLMKFVEGGYKEDGVLMPFYMSPLGPLGLAQGMVLSAGFALSDIFFWLQETFGLSPVFAGMLLFGSAFVSCFMAIVFLAILLTTQREKQD